LFIPFVIPAKKRVLVKNSGVNIVIILFKNQKVLYAGGTPARKNLKPILAQAPTLRLDHDHTSMVSSLAFKVLADAFILTMISFVYICVLSRAS